MIDVDERGRPVYSNHAAPTDGARGQFQFMTGSWRQAVDEVYDAEQRRRTLADVERGLARFGARFRSWLRARFGREVPLAERRRTAHAEIRMIGDRHGLASHGIFGPVLGCPWCIDDERAERADDVLGALNPDEHYLLSAHTSRFVLAIGDLARERSR